MSLLLYLIIPLYIPEYKIWQFSYFFNSKKKKQEHDFQTSMCAWFFSSFNFEVFACFVTPKYRWLGGIYYFVLFCTVYAYICIPFYFYLAHPLSKQIWFSLPFVKTRSEQNCTSYVVPWKCLSLTSFVQKLSPSKLHTSPNLLHWTLNFLELFPREKWNAEYEGCCLLISQLRKFVSGDCILNM